MRVAFALGSNVGDSSRILRDAVEALVERGGLSCARRSSVYRTAPWGVVDQPDFLNVVVVGDSDLDPHTLLALGHALEQEAGRVRTVVNGPRTLDVDLLAVGDRVSDEPALTLPHPRAHERGFVLVPWGEADPDFVLPGHGRIADLAAAIDRSGVHLQEER